MKIKVDYVENDILYEMRRVEDWRTGKNMLVNMGGRYLPF